MDENDAIQPLSLVGEATRALPVRYTGDDEGARAWVFTEDPLSPAQQAVVDQATQVIQTCLLNIAQNIFEVGRQLVRVKQIVKHGSFLAWLDQAFGLKERTAQHWMNVYLRLGTNAPLWQRVKPTALYYLAMPSTPAEAIAQVAEKILAGEYLSVQQVMALIAACRIPPPAEDLETVAARLTKAVGKASARLSNRTVEDCERVLGEAAAERLDAVRTELDELLEQVQPFLPRRRSSHETALHGCDVSAPACELPLPDREEDDLIMSVDQKRNLQIIEATFVAEHGRKLRRDERAIFGDVVQQEGLAVAEHVLARLRGQRWHSPNYLRVVWQDCRRAAGQLDHAAPGSTSRRPRAGNAAALGSTEERLQRYCPAEFADIIRS